MEELDKFKNIKDKVSFVPVQSPREEELWNALEQRINTYESKQNRKNKIRSIFYYASAACVVLGLSIGYYFISIHRHEATIASSNPTVKTSTPKSPTATNTAPEHIHKNEETRTIPNKDLSKEKTSKFTIAPATKTLHASTTQYLAMTDGTTVTLDAHSNIHHQNNFLSQRDVMLEGLAYFEVAHDASHPFTVYFANTHLIVLGTKFYVNAVKSGNYTVSVVEGSVKVYDPTKKQYTVLIKNQELESVDNQYLQVRAVDSHIDAWKINALKFDDSKLPDVFFALSKAFGKEISYAPGLSECRFSGNLSNLNLVEALNFIKLTAQIEIEDKNGHVHIAGKACQ